MQVWKDCNRVPDFFFFFVFLESFPNILLDIYVLRRYWSPQANKKNKKKGKKRKGKQDKSKPVKKKAKK